MLCAKPTFIVPNQSCCVAQHIGLIHVVTGFNAVSGNTATYYLLKMAAVLPARKMQACAKDPQQRYMKLGALVHVVCKGRNV